MTSKKQLLQELVQFSAHNIKLKEELDEARQQRDHLRSVLDAVVWIVESDRHGMLGVKDSLEKFALNTSFVLKAEVESANE